MASRLSLVLALALALIHGALGMQKIKGMAFGTGHDLWSIRQPFAVKSLNNLKKTGINMVHVSSYMRMNNKYAWFLRTETDEASIRFQIRLHKKHGLKVFFKPVIEIGHGNNLVWRGFIPPRDAWLYKVYMPWIRRMARIAQQEQVDLFAVGSEYVGLEVRTQTWRNIIRSVRQVYFRELTYVANHDVSHLRFSNFCHLVTLSEN